MLSKQDKLKYGQQLRRQMKQKQQKKRNAQLEKRGFRKVATQARIPYQPQSYQINKQVLQNKFAADSVDYYGRPGGGAPNRPNMQAANQPLQHQLPQYAPIIQNPIPKIKQPEQQISYSDQVPYNQNYPFSPPTMILQQQPIDNIRQGYNEQSLPYSRSNIPQQYPSSINNNMYIPTNYNQNYPSQQQQQYQYQDNNQNIIMPSDRPILNDQYPQYQISKQKQLIGYNEQKTNTINQVYKNQGQPADIYQIPIQEINDKHEINIQKNQQHQEIMQIHKRGGRNLLKLQNMTIDQQQVKQKQKQQMRRQLELQIKQTQDRKKQQIQKKHREELQQQKKNIQYKLLQKKREEEEEFKKMEKFKNIELQNIKNIQQRKKIQLEANSQLNKLKSRDQQSSQSIQHSSSVHNSPTIPKKQSISKKSQAQIPIQQTISQTSSIIDRQNDNYGTKHYLQNERKKDQQRYNRQKNIEVVTDEIRKLKQQIDQQQQIFLKQIQKVKLSSQAIQQQKKIKQIQIENLKKQLQSKMKQDNQKLFIALQKQDQFIRQQSQNYTLPKKNITIKQNHPSNDYYMESLKPDRNQKFIKKKYQIPQQQNKKQLSIPPIPPTQPISSQYQINYNHNFGQSIASDHDQMMVSLHGDSKKIPLNLPQKLTMSKVGDFARQTQFFRSGDHKNIYTNQKNNDINYLERIQDQQRIQQQDQNRGDSKNIQRQLSSYVTFQKDALNQFTQHPKQQKQKRWGQMSSVNDDITKQIQQLLKKKDNHRPPSSSKKYQARYQPIKYNQRPSSNLSRAGKRVVSQGLEYDGMSIGTVNSNAGNGTLDIQKINNKNQRRLNQLRNLGVQTINTNNDQQFSKLDMILNKYKQSNGQ